MINKITIATRECNSRTTFMKNKSIGKAAPAVDIKELNCMDLISMDFFHTSNGNHLRIVDRASAYKKHCKTKGQSTSELIRKLE